MTNAGSLRTIVAAYVVLVALTLVSFVSEGYAKGRAVQAIEVNGRLVVVTVRLFPRNERKEGWYYYDDNGKRIPIEIKTANRDGIPILSKRDVERLDQQLAEDYQRFYQSVQQQRKGWPGTKSLKPYDTTDGTNRPQAGWWPPWGSVLGAVAKRRKVDPNVTSAEQREDASSAGSGGGRP